MKTLVLALTLSLSLAAQATTTAYYWGLADNAQSDGKHAKVLVLGKRIEDATKNLITDTQLYTSPEEGTAEYRYEFDFKTKKMSAFSKGKPAGSGTFECDGTLEKHTSCTYEYKTEGASGYRATGKDVLRVDGTYYRETSDIFYTGKTEPVVYTGNYFEVTKPYYEGLRKKLLGR